MPEERDSTTTSVCPRKERSHSSSRSFHRRVSMSRVGARQNEERFGNEARKVRNRATEVSEKRCARRPCSKFRAKCSIIEGNACFIILTLQRPVESPFAFCFLLKLWYVVPCLLCRSRDGKHPSDTNCVFILHEYTRVRVCIRVRIIV